MRANARRLALISRYACRPLAFWLICCVACLLRRELCRPAGVSGSAPIARRCARRARVLGVVSLRRHVEYRGGRGKALLLVGEEFVAQQLCRVRQPRVPLLGCPHLNREGAIAHGAPLHMVALAAACCICRHSEELGSWGKFVYDVEELLQQGPVFGVVIVGYEENCVGVIAHGFASQKHLANEFPQPARYESEGDLVPAPLVKEGVGLDVGPEPVNVRLAVESIAVTGRIHSEIRVAESLLPEALPDCTERCLHEHPVSRIRPGS